MGQWVQKRRTARHWVFVMLFLAAVALEFFFFGRPLLALQTQVEDSQGSLIYSGRLVEERKQRGLENIMLFEISPQFDRPILRARM